MNVNERIKELAQQCRSHRVDGALVDGQLHFDTQKFAELIVKECMKLNSKELSITAIERLLPLYAEHFGVEK